MIQTEQNITFINKINIIFGKLQERSILKLFSREKKLTNISIFQNLSQINIELWNEILNTQNLHLLNKKHTEDTKYSKRENEALNAKFIELYDDYFLKLDNQFAKNNLKETQEKIQLSAKIMILTDCINTLLSIKRNYNVLKVPLKKENEVYECVKLISKYIKFERFNTIDENIKVIEKLIVSNETTYKRKFGETEKDFEEKTYTFEKQVVDVEQVLGHSIDTTKVNVLKWIGYINLAQEISKKRAENGKRKD
jgi:hypothetical protein